MDSGGSNGPLQYEGFRDVTYTNKWISKFQISILFRVKINLYKEDEDIPVYDAWEKLQYDSRKSKIYHLERFKLGVYLIAKVMNI